MSKSHVEELSRVYVAIFQDLTYAYPTLGDAFQKDLERLLSLVKQRGLRLFTVDLPALAKHLDRCLASGAYVVPSENLPLSARKRGPKMGWLKTPKFLGELYLRVFDQTGVLKEDCDVEAIFWLRQVLLAAKKTAVQCPRKAVFDEIEDFISIDTALPEPENFWFSESPTLQELSDATPGFRGSRRYSSKVGSLPAPLQAVVSLLLANLDLVSGLVCSALGPYRYEDWNFRHGPGAISNGTRKSNKYSWTNWSNRLERVFPIDDCGFHNSVSWAGNIQHLSIDSKEPSSKMFDVLKTYTKPRLIAAEPSEHQWCQQNIWHYFCTRTRESWIGDFVRFNDQTHNQELCRRGSQDGRLATVDLSAASDRVTCHAVGQLFRRNIGLLQALQASRTLSIEIPQLSQASDDCTILRLRKFSTMGSACTFPVESLMFLSVTLAAVLTTRRMSVTLRNISTLVGEVAIFGDDIIVPEDSRELLVQALEILDFKVNSNKSFWTGLFRESCGVDSYAGVDITPAYWKSLYDGTPETYTSTVEVANNFYMKFLVNTSAYLESTIYGYRVPVVPVVSEVCGVKSFVTPLPDQLFRSRWNEELQRSEYRMYVPLGRSTSTPLTDDTALLQFFTEAPEPSQPWQGGKERRARLRVKPSWVPAQSYAPAQRG